MILSSVSPLLTRPVVEAAPHHLHALLQFLRDGERGGGDVRERPSPSLRKEQRRRHARSGRGEGDRSVRLSEHGSGSIRHSSRNAYVKWNLLTLLKPSMRRRRHCEEIVATVATCGSCGLEAWWFFVCLRTHSHEGECFHGDLNYCVLNDFSPVSVSPGLFNLIN